MDGASTVPSGDPMAGGDPMSDGQPPMDGQDPAVGGDPMTDDTAMGGDPMDGAQPSMDDGEGDDSTMSIINQLSDEDREAVRAYAESMLSKSKGEQEAPAGEGPMMDDPAMGEEQSPMMESFIFTKKQLNTLMENFGPTEDELQKQDERKPLSKKKEKTVSDKSPFNSPKFK